MSLNSGKINFKKLCINNNTLCFLKTGYGTESSVEEVETTNFLGLQTNGNLNWKTRRIYHPQLTFCMLCNGDSHNNHEQKKPKISSFCLQPVMVNEMIFWRNSMVTKKKKKKKKILKQNYKKYKIFNNLIHFFVKKILI